MRFIKAQEELIKQAIKDFQEFEDKGYPLGEDTPPGDQKDKKDRAPSSGKKDKGSEKSAKDGKKGDTKSKKGQEEELFTLDPIKLAQVDDIFYTYIEILYDVLCSSMNMFSPFKLWQVLPLSFTTSILFLSRSYFDLTPY